MFHMFHDVLQRNAAQLRHLEQEEPEELCDGKHQLCVCVFVKLLTQHAQCANAFETIETYEIH